jgi:succinyl-diaminopimelate desuccinylase
MDVGSFLDVAVELLSVESTADRPDELDRALSLVFDFIGPGFSVERFESGGKPSALAYHGATRPRFAVILNAHLDVVPAPPAQFRPRREGDRLYARGAQDMKVSALLQALAFRELAGRVAYPLGLQLVTDEEVGGSDGTRHQLREGVTAGFALIGETSGLRIVTECKGAIRARLRATGRSAHGAYPWLGDNALLKLHRTIGTLLSAYPVPDTEGWRTTVNVARVSTANQAFNQVPAEAEAWLDIRFPAGDPGLDRKTAEQVTAYLQQFCAPGVTAVTDSIDAPHHADERRPEITRLQEAARGQGYTGDFLRKHGTADVRFYSEYGIACVSFGIGGDGQHGPGEYADITTITPYYEALTQFLLAPSAVGQTGLGHASLTLIPRGPHVRGGLDGRGRSAD